jgi:uncharacterized protein YkwD
MLVLTWRRLLVAVLASVAVMGSLPPLPAAAKACAGPAKRATLCLLNGERAAAGLRALRLDSRLSRAAEAHSADMVARHYFDHVSPSGEQLAQRVERTGWMRRRPHWALGETLGWGTGSLGTPEAMVRAWMRSPAHRRIVLRPGFRRVGIGIAGGTPFGTPSEGVTYTADFGAGHRRPQ